MAVVRVQAVSRAVIVRLSIPSPLQGEGEEKPFANVT